LQARLNDYESRVRKSAAEVPTKVQAAKAPAAVKADFVVAVRQCGGDLVRETLAFVAHQRKALTAADELLTFAQARPGRYQIDGNRLRFADAADQKKHDALRRALDGLVGQRDDMTRRLRDTGEQALADLEAAPNVAVHAAVE
jgi:hypothetical protein